MFFSINLHFSTSNQISTYRKLNLHRSNKQYLFCLLISLEMQKNTLEQTKMYHTFSYFVWKGTTHKPLKVAAAKTFFSSVYVIGTTCFDERFSFCVITGRHYFSWKINVTLRFLFKYLDAAFFETSVWKKSVFYALSPQ